MTEQPSYLTTEEIVNLSLPIDRRCIVCLERAYSIYSGYDPRVNVGCPFGKTHKEQCHEMAIPNATNRTRIRKQLAEDLAAKGNGNV